MQTQHFLVTSFLLQGHVTGHVIQPDGPCSYAERRKQEIEKKKVNLSEKILYYDQ